MRATEVVEELAIRRRLLQRVQRRSVQVLEQGVPEEIFVVGHADDGRDQVQPGGLRRTPPPLSHDELVASGLVDDGPHDDGLKDADLLDRTDELVQLALVEGGARLPRVGADVSHGQLGERGPGDGNEAVLVGHVRGCRRLRGCRSRRRGVSRSGRRRRTSWDVVV